MKRRILDRIHDRAWREVGDLLSTRQDILADPKQDEPASSISSTMPWATICSAFADGEMDSRKFRRTTAVREIVETVGPVDGCFYAERIREWGPEYFTFPGVRKIDAWGDPLRWPGLLLGTPRSFSPTSLRYLATALWLKKSGYLETAAEIVEIGVGFGGLAAMNALVSQSITTLVDLPQVERSAMRMLTETGLAEYGRLSRESNESSGKFVISNYAFTELNSKLQKFYFDRYISKSSHGIIVSNSAVFASTIQGRSDEDLVAWFRSEGMAASLVTTSDLLGPSDRFFGVSLIHW